MAADHRAAADAGADGQIDETVHILGGAPAMLTQSSRIHIRTCVVHARVDRESGLVERPVALDDAAFVVDANEIRNPDA